MHNKYKALIIDDEFPARLMIKNLLAPHFDDIQVIGEAKTGREALKIINDDQPDIIFLDIQLPDFNGFELLAQLKHQPTVVFTTAFDQYALDAFKENSLDYLVKPIEQDRFDRAIEKIKSFNYRSTKIDIDLLISSINRQDKKRTKNNFSPIFRNGLLSVWQWIYFYLYHIWKKIPFGIKTS